MHWSFGNLAMALSSSMHSIMTLKLYVVLDIRNATQSWKLSRPPKKGSRQLNSCAKEWFFFLNPSLKPKSHMPIWLAFIVFDVLLPVIIVAGFPSPCDTAVTSVSETVQIMPKMATVTSGQLVCFNCTTSHLEAHWQIEDDFINGDADRVNGLTFISHCFNVTKNVTVTCHGVTSTPSNQMSPGADTAKVILIQG